ncbi:MAG: MFS transporter [Halobacteriales archaeon]|nr:MFS transporter [Halobacteriales archaeon]
MVALPARPAKVPAAAASFTRIARPGPERAKPVDGLRLLLLSTAWLGLAAVTGGFLDNALPGLLGLRGGAQGSGWWAPAAMLALATAAVALPLAGRWSDRLQGMHGQRRTPMFFGGLLAAAGLGLGFAVEGVVGILAALLLLQVGAAVAQAGAQALLVDVVPTQRRGLGAGLKGLCEVAGVAVAGIAAGFLLAETGASRGLFLLLGALLLPLAIALAAVRGHDRPTPSVQPDMPILTKLPLLNAFAAPSRAFARAAAARACAVAGLLLLTRVLAGADLFASGSLVLLGAAAFGALAGGGMSDAMGRKPVVQSGGLVLAAGALLLLLLARTPTAMLVFGALAVLGGAMLLAATWASLADLAPRREAGRSLGLAASWAACAALAVLLLLALGALPEEGALLGAVGLGALAALALPGSGEKKKGAAFAVVTTKRSGALP